MANSQQARCTRDVLNDDRRIPWQVSPEIAGERARILIITPARRIADGDGNRLASVESIVLVAPRRNGESKHRHYRQRNPGRRMELHRTPLFISTTGASLRCTARMALS